MPTLQAVCVSCVVQHWSELAAAAALAQDSDDHHDGVECAAQYARQALAALPIEVAELVLKRLSPAALALTEHVIAQHTNVEPVWRQQYKSQWTAKGTRATGLWKERCLEKQFQLCLVDIVARESQGDDTQPSDQKGLLEIPSTACRSVFAPVRYPGDPSPQVTARAEEEALWTLGAVARNFGGFVTRLVLSNATAGRVADAAERLAVFLPRLTALELHNLRDDCADVACRLLRGVPSVTSLTVAYAHCSGVELESLLADLGKGRLRDFVLVSTPISQQVAQGLEVLVSSQPLESLELLHTGAHDRILATALRSLPAFDDRAPLTLLRLVDCYVNAFSIMYLADAISDAPRLRKLQTLVLSDCAVEAPSCRQLALALKKHDSVESLSLTDCLIGDIGVAVLCREYFAHARRLKHLDLRSCDMRAEGLKRLADVSSSFRVLSVADNKLYGDVGPSIAALVSRLESLDLSRCRLQTCSAPVVVKAIANAPTLRSLALAENRIGDEGLSLLAPALGQAPSLERIDLRKNMITMKGVVSLARSLAARSSRLQAIDLRGNFLGRDTAAAKQLLSQTCGEVLLDHAQTSLPNVAAMDGFDPR